MKKLIVILALFAITPCFAREEAPVLPSNGNVDIKYTDDSLDLINTDKMKRSDSVKEAKSKLKKTTSPVEIDTNSMMQQRALDYITNPNKGLMPPVL